MDDENQHDHFLEHTTQVATLELCLAGTGDQSTDEGCVLCAHQFNDAKKMSNIGLLVWQVSLDEIADLSGDV